MSGQGLLCGGGEVPQLLPEVDRRRLGMIPGGVPTQNCTWICAIGQQQQLDLDGETTLKWGIASCNLDFISIPIGVNVPRYERNTQGLAKVNTPNLKL